MDGASLTPAVAAALVALATLAGLDLVSVLQGMLSRPLVVGAASGLLLGDPVGGLRIGALLELFALDVVPVGASRYPDFSAATMAAVAFGAHLPWTTSLGAAAGLGLVLATAGGATIPVVRRWNARIVRARADALAAGDAAAVRRVHLVCLRNDLARAGSLALAFAAVGLGLAAADLRPGPELGPWLTLVAIAGGAWAMAHGATVTTQRGARVRWAAGGVAVGITGALLW